MFKIPDYFDLLGIQQIVRETKSPRNLYSILDWCHTLFEKGHISKSECSEISDFIKEELQKISKIKKQVDG